MSENRWLSADEIAEYLGVKRDTIYKWIVRHDLPAHKAGRLWKFRKHEVDEWIMSANSENAAENQNQQSEVTEKEAM